MDTANESKRSNDVSRWKIIYPVYIDRMKSISNGRAISFTNCIENPTAAEIAEACIQMGIPCQIECRRHPRDFKSLGRIRYSLLDSDGNPYNSQVLNRRQLLNSIGKRISELRMRQQKPLQQTEATTSKANINEQSNMSNSGTSGGKCKAKKKK